MSNDEEPQSAIDAVNVAPHNEPAPILDLKRCARRLTDCHSAVHRMFHVEQGSHGYVNPHILADIGITLACQAIRDSLPPKCRSAWADALHQAASSKNQNSEVSE